MERIEVKKGREEEEGRERNDWKEGETKRGNK